MPLESCNRIDWCVEDPARMLWAAASKAVPTRSNTSRQDEGGGSRSGEGDEVGGPLLD